MTSLFDISDETDKKDAVTVSLSKFEERIRLSLHSDPSLREQWVTAEIQDLRSSGGHAYMELIEKDSSGTSLAKIRGTIWRGTLAAMQRSCGSKLSALLANGNEVRVRVSVNFHVLFGLSLNISEIDPDYQRDTSKLQAEILAALTKEGIRDKNKERPLTFPAQRIAVISAPGAAGYGDFMNQLTNNPSGIKIYTALFSAVMQGTAVSASVRSALARIEMCADAFDCVVIIRGGGATSDLAGFDDLQLARAVANCMLPVVVGIGHERDNTVLDYIAHTRVKTPTAAAEWLISQGEEALSHAVDLSRQIAHYVETRIRGDVQQMEHINQMIPLLARQRTSSARSRLNELSATLPLAVRNRLMRASQLLERATHTVQTAGSMRISRAMTRLENVVPLLRRDTELLLRREDNRLNQLASMIDILSPLATLRRGYSITRINGKAVSTVANLQPGQTLTTTLADGCVTSSISEINQNTETNS